MFLEPRERGSKLLGCELGAAVTTFVSSGGHLSGRSGIEGKGEPRSRDKGREAKFQNRHFQHVASVIPHSPGSNICTHEAIDSLSVRREFKAVFLRKAEV